ncbi:MAG: lipopolysaccharide assembly protein LapA domain-containing protein [Bacteroidales bacterium]
MRTGTVLLILTLISIIIFSIQNSTDVDINFLYWSSSSISLALLIIICVILGILIGMSFYVANSMKLRKVRSSLKKEIKILEAQIDALNKGLYSSQHKAVEESIEETETQSNGGSFFDA